MFFFFLFFLFFRDFFRRACDVRLFLVPLFSSASRSNVKSYPRTHQPHSHTHRFFSYFTNLSLIGLTAYFWAAGVQTLAYTLRGEKTYPLQRWPRFLQFLHRLLYSSITTFRERFFLSRFWVRRMLTLLMGWCSYCDYYYVLDTFIRGGHFLYEV